MANNLSNDNPAVKVNQQRTRNITAVYIRGFAFKCTQGGRRHQILLKLKESDEKSNDLWLLKYVAVFGLGALVGSAALVWFPLL
jgi:hypothetical protein